MYFTNGSLKKNEQCYQKTRLIIYGITHVTENERGSLLITDGILKETSVRTIDQLKNQDHLQVCCLCVTETALQCGKCKVYYCSKTCQTKDWNYHKEICV